MTALAPNDQYDQPLTPAADSAPELDDAELAHEPTAEELANAEEELELDLEAEERQSVDSMRELLKSVTAEPLLTLAEERELGRRSRLYADLRIAATVKEQLVNGLPGYPSSTRTISRFDRERFAELLCELPYEQRRQVKDSEEAFWRMYRANLRLVFSVAKRMGRIDGRADRFQEGTLGLIRAIERFDYSKGFKFSTYATWWIRQAIAVASSRAERAIVLPVAVEQELVRLRLARQRLAGKLGRDATTAELARALEVEPVRIEELERVERLEATASLSSPAGDGGEETLGDFVASGEEEDPLAQALHSYDSGSALELLAVLSPSERRILELRLGVNMHSGQQLTLEAIADNLGTSRDKVSQILERACAKLRDEALRRGLGD